MAPHTGLKNRTITLLPGLWVIRLQIWAFVIPFVSRQHRLKQKKLSMSQRNFLRYFDVHSFQVIQVEYSRKWIEVRLPVKHVMVLVGF